MSKVAANQQGSRSLPGPGEGACHGRADHVVSVTQQDREGTQAEGTGSRGKSQGAPGSASEEATLAGSVCGGGTAWSGAGESDFH